MSRRFSEEQTICFVKLYRELEPLWNVSHPDYKKRSVRVACLEKIIEQMNLLDFSVKDVMSKIRCLRSTYTQEINKIQQSMIGDEPGHIYQSLLKWLPDMDYVMKNCGTNRTKGTLPDLEFSDNDLFYLHEEVVETPIEIKIFDQPDQSRVTENPEPKENGIVQEGQLYRLDLRKSKFSRRKHFSLPQRFSEEQTVHFVKLYRELEPLWNVSHPDYKNKSVRNACLEKITDEMNLNCFSPRDTMTKIKNLRSTYCQELHKIQRSLSEDEPNHVYRPVLKWFPDMDYIMSKCGNMRTKSSVNLDYPDFYLSEEADSAIETLASIEISQQDQSNFTDSANFEENGTANLPEPDITESTRQERKLYRRRRLPSTRRTLPKNLNKSNSFKNQCQNYTVHKISEAVRELTSLSRTLRTHALQSEKVEDECDIVGRHVALQLRELPPAVRLQAQLDIQKVLFKCRFNILETNQTTPCSDP